MVLGGKREDGRWKREEGRGKVRGWKDAGSSRRSTAYVMSSAFKGKKYDMAVALVTNEGSRERLQPRLHRQQCCPVQYDAGSFVAGGGLGKMGEDALPRLLASAGSILSAAWCMFRTSRDTAAGNGRKPRRRQYRLFDEHAEELSFLRKREYRGLGFGTIVMAQAVRDMKAAGIKTYCYPEGTENVRDIINSTIALTQGLVVSIGSGSG